MKKKRVRMVHRLTGLEHKHIKEKGWQAVITDLDIVDLAIHGVVCQKSDFHGNSDIQNSKKLDPLKKKSKKIHTKIS